MQWKASRTALLFVAALVLAGPAAGQVPIAEVLSEPFHGDLAQIAQRGHLRVLTTYSRTHYFLDGPRPRGVAYEGMEAFRKQLNAKLGRKSRPIAFLYIPVPRDRLIPALAEGLGDVAAANLTITQRRLAQVDFADPFLKNVREVVVTGPGAAAPTSTRDLAGRTLFVRESATYHESLVALSRSLEAEGLPPIDIELAAEHFEDEDILEFVSAGLYDATIVDEHKAKLWADVLDGLVVHRDVAVAEHGEIAAAVRKTAPDLRAALNDFTREHKRGTLFGNVLFKRYLQQNRWVRSPAAAAERQRFLELLATFEAYGKRYDFEPLLLAAQGYQESGLDHDVRSAAGAVGIMQILPSTARSPEVGIPDIDDVESNIHAGAKYLRYLVDRYFSDPEIPEHDRVLLGMAAYNAGPARVRRLRAETAEAGLDPNRWFGNVEIIAAKRIGRETVQYVGNISKYFIAYQLLDERGQLRARPGRKGAPG
ncbi:MAG: transporter substrate-binding domain-containing protein [Myxococcota bacterium]|nr:transporter substrate-binding domain-containing protein [Myxococcota bacterium]